MTQSTRQLLVEDPVRGRFTLKYTLRPELPCPERLEDLESAFRSLVGTYEGEPGAEEKRMEGEMWMKFCDTVTTAVVSIHNSDPRIVSDVKYHGRSIR